MHCCFYRIPVQYTPYIPHTIPLHKLDLHLAVPVIFCVNSFLHTSTLTDMRLNRQRDVIAVVRPEVDLVLRESQRLGRDLVLAREHLEAGAVGRTRVVVVVDGSVALHRHRDFLVGEQDLDRFCDAKRNKVKENYTANHCDLYALFSCRPKT